MIIFCILYGIISWKFHYWGEMITYLGMSMPMAAWSTITWSQNSKKSNGSEVEIQKLNAKHIVYIKEVGPGEGISYNHTYVTDKKTKIATIPVGYADGYPRALSSKGRVLIRGQYAPIIGRICMDQFMVDVTDIEGISVMDEVTLVGHDGNKMLTVEEVANLAGSFNYEFVCGIGKRVPRVYIRNGEIKEAEYFEKQGIF